MLLSNALLPGGSVRPAWITIFILFAVALMRSNSQASGPAVDVRVQPCVDCHLGGSPSHLDDWRFSSHARFGMVCTDCHADSTSGATPIPGRGCAIERPVVITICGRCHQDVAEAFRQSPHFERDGGRARTPTCIDCHSSAGAKMLADDEVPRRCETCHPRGGAGAGSRAAELTPHLFDMLRKVALARAVLTEQLAVTQRRGAEVSLLIEEAKRVEGLVRDIPYEWHRFDLDDAAARSESALRRLESIHRQLGSVPPVPPVPVAGAPVEAPSSLERPRREPVRQITNAPLHLAVSDMIGPLATYEGYVGLFNDLSRALGRPYRFVQRQSYQEINEMLLRGELDLAFVCSGAIAAMPESGAIEILAVPMVNGRGVYRSLIIADAANPARKFEDLRGRRFAFTDPLSNTGYLFPVFRLAQLRVEPGAFFASTLFSGSHDRSIMAVHHNLVDAAAVDNMVYEKLVTPESPYWGHLRVVEESPEFPMPPVVSPITVPGDLRTRMREFLLGLSRTAEGRERLAALGFDGFAASDIANYSVIRAMRRTIASDTR